MLRGRALAVALITLLLGASICEARSVVTEKSVDASPVYSIDAALDPDARTLAGGPRLSPL